MATFPNAFGWGYVVNKAAANLPQSTTSTLYTVAGGAVLIQAMFGVVTTSCGATVTTLALGTAPTGGNASTTSIAAATAITSKGVGTFYVPQWSAAVSGTPAIANTVLVVPLPASTASFLAYTGTITWTTSASDTGQMAWYLTYVPIDSGATVS